MRDRDTPTGEHCWHGKRWVRARQRPLVVSCREGSISQDSRPGIAWSERETDTDADKHTEKQKQTQTRRETDRQGEKETQRQTNTERQRDEEREERERHTYVSLSAFPENAVHG